MMGKAGLDSASNSGTQGGGTARPDLLSKLVRAAFFTLVFVTPISTALTEISIVFLLIGAGIHLIKTGKTNCFPLIPNIFLYAFLIVSLLSLTQSGGYLHKALAAVLWKWIPYGLLFLTAQRFFRNAKHLEDVITVFLMAAVLLCLDGLFQYFFGSDFLRGRPLVAIQQDYAGGTSRIFFGMTAAFQHYNAFGSYLAFAGIIGFVRLMTMRENRKRLIYTGVMLLILVCLFLTYSRTAWLMFYVGCLIVLTVTRRRVLLGMLVLWPVCLFLIPSVRDRILFTFTSPYGLSERLEMWRIAWSMIREHPLLGSGVGTYMDYSAAYSDGRYAYYAHNCYLQIWAESGIFALISFVLFAIFLLRSGVKTFKRNADGCSLGLTSALFAFLAGCFLDVQLYALPLAVLFWSFAGLASASSLQTAKSAA